MTDYPDDLECWSCGCNEFNIQIKSGEAIAVCVECAREESPSQLYRPEETPREEYELSGTSGN